MADYKRRFHSFSYFPNHFSTDFLMFELLNGYYYIVQLKDYFYSPPKLNNSKDVIETPLESLVINRIDEDDLIPNTPCLVLNPYSYSVIHDNGSQIIKSNVEIHYYKIKLG